MANTPFDPLKELAAVKQRRALQKRQHYRKSKLQAYRAEIIAMRQAGASNQDLATWLKMKHRLKIHRASVARYLATLPELSRVPTVPIIQVTTAATDTSTTAPAT